MACGGRADHGPQQCAYELELRHFRQQYGELRVRPSNPNRHVPVVLGVPRGVAQFQGMKKLTGHGVQCTASVIHPFHKPASRSQIAEYSIERRLAVTRKLYIPFLTPPLSCRIPPFTCAVPRPGRISHPRLPLPESELHRCHREKTATLPSKLGF